MLDLTPWKPLAIDLDLAVAQFGSVIENRLQDVRLSKQEQKRSDKDKVLQRKVRKELRYLLDDETLLHEFGGGDDGAEANTQQLDMLGIKVEGNA